MTNSSNATASVAAEVAALGLRPAAFASGLIYGLLEGTSLQTAVEYGAAHGALAMTTPGDTSMATADQVIKLADGGSARVDR